MAQPLASASQSGLASQIATFLAQRGIFVPAHSIVVSGDAVAVGNGQRVYRLTVPADQQCLVWRAFAKYGIGVGADGTVSRRGVVSITESFAVPSGCPAP